MEAYLERIKTNAQKLFKDDFPLKALELDVLINSDLLKTSQMERIAAGSNLPNPQDIIAAAISPKAASEDLKRKSESPDKHHMKKRKHSDIKEDTEKVDAVEVTGCKVIVFPNGVIESNEKIVEILKSIKPFIIHFLDSSAVIKLWIQILIPQVEDFKAELSLQIQEDSLAEIRAIESEVATYLDHIYKYYTVRGKLISKLAKYPHVADYKHCVYEFDEKMFMTARLVALELRNHYTSVHDILTKNLEKIKKPRSDLTHSMY